MKPFSKVVAQFGLFALFSQISIAQIKPFVVKNIDSGQYVKHIDFFKAPGKAPAFKLGELQMFTDTDKSEKQTNVRLIHQEQDKNQFTHYRWQETIDNIPVENAIYVQHVKEGKLMSQSGSWIRSSDVKKSTASLSELEALRFALKYINASKYAWQDPKEELMLQTTSNDKKATHYPKGELVYYSGEGVPDKSKLRLSYKFTIRALVPFSYSTLFVDAGTGKILGTRSLMNNYDVAATAQTAYSGSQTITTDYTGSNYRLHEAGRGSGITTYNMSGRYNFIQAGDFTNTSTSWTSFSPAIDQYAVDAHWGLEKVYDFYQTKFARNSLDNAGLPLTGYVHTDLPTVYPNQFSNSINALYDRNYKIMVFGDGGSGYTPLVSLDIIGHELTHGVTQFTSDLAYEGESGALNESFSDMMGMAVKFGAKGYSWWEIGNEVGTPQRDLSNPKRFSQPNTYNGSYYVTTTGCSPTGGSGGNDLCGVHTNSGVPNYWFYLVAQGATGTNDVSHSYNVTGIGLDKATNIAYQTFTQHLTSTSQMADARTESIAVAQADYSPGSLADRTVTNAWYAVNIGAAYPSESISGDFVANSCIGTTQTFSVANANPAYSYSWSVTSGLQIIGATTGNSITVQVTGNGLSIVNLNIVTPLSGTENIANKAVNVGIPALAGTDYVDRTPQSSHYQYLTSTVTQLPGTSPSDYHWYQEINNAPTATVIATGLQINHYPLAPCSTLFYRCVVTTPCGNAIYRSYAYNTACTGAMAVQNNYVAYPNPVNDKITVTNNIVPTSGIDNTTAATSESFISNSTNYQPFKIILYDGKGKVIQSAEAKGGDKEISIETLNIPDGTYYLTIIDSDKKIQKQIVISHK